MEAPLDINTQKCTIQLNYGDGSTTIEFSGRLLKYFGLFQSAYDEMKFLAFAEPATAINASLEPCLWRRVFKILEEEERYREKEIRMSGCFIPYEKLAPLTKMIQMPDLFRIVKMMDYVGATTIVEMLLHDAINRTLSLSSEEDIELMHPKTVAMDDKELATLFTHHSQPIAHTYNIVRERLRRIFSDYIDTYNVIQTIETYLLPPTTSFLASGSDFSGIICNGILIMEGNNDSGQLCSERTEIKARRRENKKPVFPGGKAVISVWCGGSHNIVLTLGGLYGSGSNEFGQQGRIGDSSSSHIKSIRARDVFSVACGKDFTLFHTTQGLFAAGDNSFSQFGLGDDAPVLDDTSESGPVKIPFGDHTIISMACGDAFSAILADGGDVYLAGQDIGSGNNKNLRKSFTKLVFPDVNTKILSIAVGGEYAMFLSTKGKIFSMGRNGHGQLCLGDNAPRKTPTEVKNPSRLPIVAIFVGNDSTFMVDEVGDLFACGINTHAKLGLGDKKARKLPEKVKDVSRVISVSSEKELTFIYTCKGVFDVGVPLHYVREWNENSRNKYPICKEEYRIETDTQNKRRKMGTGAVIACHFCGCSDTKLLGTQQSTQRTVCLSGSCVQK